MIRMLCCLSLLACNRTSIDLSNFDDRDGGFDPNPDGPIAAGRCPGSPALIISPSIETLRGDTEIAGTIQLPQTTTEPLPASLIVGRSVFDDLGVGNISETVTIPAGTNSLSYSVRSLKADVYHLHLLVDVDRSLTLDPLDWAGFHGGTTATPAQYAGLRAIDTTVADVCAANFGIGNIVCRAAYGQSCTVDDDCRGTITECEGGGKGLRRTGACQGTCTELPAESCGNEATLGTTEGSCIGSFF